MFGFARIQKENPLTVVVQLLAGENESWALGDSHVSGRTTTAGQIVGFACSVVKSHRQKEKSTLPAEGSHQGGEQGEAPARTIVLNCLVKSNRKFS